MDNRKLLPAQGPNLVEQRGIYQFQPTNTIKYLLKYWVAQLCFSGSAVLMALWRIAISGSGCQVVFRLVLTVLSSPRSREKINIVKLFLCNISSSCYIRQGPGVIINTSSRVLTAIMIWPARWCSHLTRLTGQHSLGGGGWWNLTQIILTGTNLSRHRIRRQNWWENCSTCLLFIEFNWEIETHSSPQDI